MAATRAERQTIWVTGAAGFLGAAACARLARDGHAVRPVLRPARAAGATGAGAVICDLAEEALAAQDDGAPETIVHLAAEIPAAADDEAMQRVAARNRRIDDNVFDFAASVGAAVVFASSGSVYGPASGALFTEDGPVDPQGPYAEAKLRSEQVGAEALAAAGRPFAALRISAPYGPGQPTRTVVQLFLRRAMAGEELAFHGSGSRRQDFVWVGDVADAVAACCRRRADGVFNVASGRPVTMRELTGIVVAVVGREVAVRPSGRPDPQEGRAARYAIAAAERELGWKPSTPLRAGLGLWRDRLAQEEEEKKKELEKEEESHIR